MNEPYITTHTAPSMWETSYSSFFRTSRTRTAALSLSIIDARSAVEMCFACRRERRRVSTRGTDRQRESATLCVCVSLSLSLSLSHSLARSLARSLSLSLSLSLSEIFCRLPARSLALPAAQGKQPPPSHLRERGPHHRQHPLPSQPAEHGSLRKGTGGSPQREARTKTRRASPPVGSKCPLPLASFLARKRKFPRTAHRGHGRMPRPGASGCAGRHLS